MLGTYATAASPLLGQAIWEDNGRAIVDAHTGEALQDGQGNRVSGNQMLPARSDNLLQQGRRVRGETLVDRLWRDIHPDTGGAVRKVRDTGIRMCQEAKNQGLGKRSGRKPGAVGALGRVQFGVGGLGGCAQEMLHGWAYRIKTGASYAKASRWLSTAKKRAVLRSSSQHRSSDCGRENSASGNGPISLAYRIPFLIC